MDNKALIFATQVVSSQVWIVGSMLATGNKAEYMLGIGVGWLVVAVFLKLTGK